MPQRTPSCQLGVPTSSDSRLISPQSGDTQCPPVNPDTHNPTIEFEHATDYSSGRDALVRGAAQEVAHTASRRSGPRRWLRAVVWLIAAGLHGRANATTQRVAEDLAARMDYDTGHARYLLDETADRLGMSRATVKRHVAVLRELGALAWVQHGTRANVRHKLGLGGYAATATVYAAVIPAAYDHAMGHTIIGTGYRARIIVDLRNRNRPVDNSLVDNSSSDGLEPPSLVVVKEDGQVQMGGGFNYTPRERASRPKTAIPHQSNSSSEQGTRRNAKTVARGIQTTRMVRALVNWTQKIPLRRLEFVLRPLTDRGLDSYQIAAELHAMCSGVRWRPAKPDQFIHATLQREQQQIADQRAQEREEEALEAAATEPNRAFLEARQDLKARDRSLVEYPRIEEVGLSDIEAEELREIGRKHPAMVVRYVQAAGEAAAVALYGRMTVDHAHRLVGASA